MVNNGLTPSRALPLLLLFVLLLPPYRYCGALCCGALGTVAAVFLSLAVNECGTDTGAMALLHHKVRSDRREARRRSRTDSPEDRQGCMTLWRQSLGWHLRPHVHECIAQATQRWV